MAIDLSALATLVQTIVITLTLLVFIFQFRSQEKAIRESSYQNVLGRYNDYVMSGSSSDDLILARLFSPAREFSKDEIAGVRRLMIAYGIIEETYELYKKKWIDKETWDQWDAWLKVMIKYPDFAMLHGAASGMFDKDFQDYVTQLIKSDSSGSRSG
jgi:high-affinity Fe2+/Pb2+ permease